MVHFIQNDVPPFCDRDWQLRCAKQPESTVLTYCILMVVFSRLQRTLSGSQGQLDNYADHQHNRGRSSEHSAGHRLVSPLAS